MDFSNCNDSITSIARKLTNVVMNEAECLPQNSTNSSARPFPEYHASIHNWTARMGNCKLELIFLKGVTWLKHLIRTTNYVSTDELKRMLYPLGGREVLQEVPIMNFQDQTRSGNLRMDVLEIQKSRGKMKLERKRKKMNLENLSEKSIPCQFELDTELLCDSQTSQGRTGNPQILRRNIEDICEVILNSDCDSQTSSSEKENSRIIINDIINSPHVTADIMGLSQGGTNGNANFQEQNFVRSKKRCKTTETTPQRSFKQYNMNLNIHRNISRIISTFEQESSQKSPDMFESQSQRRISQRIDYADSGMGSMFFPQETNPVEQVHLEEPPPKKQKQGLSVVSAEVLMTFMDDEPINNVGLQVVRGLLSALERRDAVKNCLDIFEEMQEAVDVIIDFINSSGDDELEFSGYVSFCIPAAVETIQRVCIDLNYSDIEQNLRLCHVQIILELCNNKEICQKTIQLFIKKIKDLLDSREEPIAREMKMKIMWIFRCLQLVIEKYSSQFLKDPTRKKVNIATELWRQRWGKNDTIENKKTVGEELENSWGRELRIIYIETKNIFPRFAHLMKEMSRLLVTQQA